MLWPLVAPIEITFWILVALVATMTVIAPWLKRQRSRMFLQMLGIACAVFIPSCSGIMDILDRGRFGSFEYATFQDVHDPRTEQYLPTTAKNIRMVKSKMGYSARYEISGEDFDAYLDQLWGRYVTTQADRSRAVSEPGRPTSRGEQVTTFAKLGWQPLSNAATYHGPPEGDGGGAVYYFDREAGIAYQRTGYW